MPDEVAADHSGISLRLEQLEQLVIELLLTMCEADETSKTDQPAAALQTVAALADFIPRAAHHIRGDIPYTGPLPGEALRRLLMALIDVNQGVPDPLLSTRRNAKKEKKSNNALLLKVRLDRINAVVAVELLYQAGRSWKDAFEEAAKALEGSQILANRQGKPFPGKSSAIVARWRTEIMSGDNSDDIKIFNNVLKKTMYQARLRGSGSDELAKIAHALLLSVATRAQLDRFE